MLLNELNLKALNINAESVLPMSVTLCVEGKEVEFKITAFQSGYGSGKKSVISGIVSLNDTNHTSTELNNSDIESIRRKVSKLLGLKNTSERKPRTPKTETEVQKLRTSLAVARRLPKEWCKIDTAAVWKAYQEAKKVDHEKAKEALKEKTVSPLLEKISKLSPGERALLLASLQ